MSEKTEKASPKKRQDERKKGNVFQSKDVVTVGIVASCFYILKLWTPYVYKFTSDILIKYISYIKTKEVITDSFLYEVFTDIITTTVLVSGVIMVSVIIASIIITGAQTRFLVSRENIKFKLSKINPIKGFKRLFSIRSIIEVIKGIIKLVILGFIVYNTIIKNLPMIPKLMFIDIKASINFIFEVIMSLVNAIIIAFVAIAVLDYVYQWWEYERNIKMSKQDIKEEYKQMEGDPQLKGKIKEKQRGISMMRMMQQVPDADVIIRNPTHFAIAIKYDVNKSSAPVVIAKGQDYIALKIIDKATECKIHMVENKPLARALYDNAELNKEIPVQFYEPVAEILAWVYKLKEKGN